MVCSRNIGQEIYDVSSLWIIFVALIVFSSIISFFNDAYLVKYTLLIVSLLYVADVCVDVFS